MKELSIEQKSMDYEKKYKELVDNIEKAYLYAQTDSTKAVLEEIRPELKESEDEKIRKWLIAQLELKLDIKNPRDLELMILKSITWLEKQGEQKTYSWKPTKEQFEALDYAYNSCPDTERGNYYEGVLETLIKDLHKLEKQGETFTKKDVDDAYLKGVSDTKNEIEKQYEANYQIRKDIATFIFNYRGDLKDRAKWMDYLGIKAYFVQEQDKQNPQPTLTPKSAIEAAKEEKVDNQNCVKPAEPKFHEGDWIVKKGTIYRIDKISGVYITLSTIDGTALVYHKSVLCSERIHLWTIEDAKDGDVLIASDESIFIYAGSTDRHAKFYLALTKCGKLNVDGGNWENKNSVHPATKEQRDTLFTKMKEAGYEWDAEKKELKIVDWSKHIKYNPNAPSITKEKPTWSEEDEKISQWIISDIENLFYLDKKSSIISNIEIDWLKSLKERIGG